MSKKKNPKILIDPGGQDLTDFGIPKCQGFQNYFIIFKCVCVCLSVCVSLFVCIQVQVSAEARGIDSPGTGFRDCCEPPEVDAEH